MRSVTCFLTVLLLAPAWRANAQEPPPIETGQRVRLSYDCRTRTLSTGVVRSDCRRQSGTVIMLRGDTLLLTVGKSTEIHRLSALALLEVSRGRRSHWLNGAAMGAPAGAVAGLGILTLANGQWVCGDHEIGGLCWVVAGAGVTGGALVGALVGANVKADRWKEVPLDQVRGTIVPYPCRRFGVAATLRF